MPLRVMDMTTAPEAAKLRGVNRQRVCEMARNGQIPGAKKIGGIWFIPVEWAKQPNNKRKLTDFSRNVHREKQRRG